MSVLSRVVNHWIDQRIAQALPPSAPDEMVRGRFAERDPYDPARPTRRTYSAFLDGAADPTPGIVMTAGEWPADGDEVIIRRTRTDGLHIHWAIIGRDAAAVGGGFDSPMTELGDLIVGGEGGETSVLPVGTVGDVLTVGAGAGGDEPGWAAPTAPEHHHGAVAVRVRRATTQPVASGIGTPISFELARWDTHGFWSAGTPAGMTVPAGMGGHYLIGLHVAFAAGAGSFRDARPRFTRGGTALLLALHQQPLIASVENRVSSFGSYLLEPGDFIEGLVQHDAGASLNLVPHAGASSIEMWMLRVGT